MSTDARPWFAAVALTIVMSIATGIGTYASSYLLLSVKMKEETAKAVVERRSKGTQLHCEKLQSSAVLAAEIEFSANRGYPNAIFLTDLAFGVGKGRPQMVPESKIVAEQLALEKRASELIPFLSEPEASILSTVTLHHNVVTAMRTSNVPHYQRTPPSQGGHNANDELQGIRDGAAKLASMYRTRCTEEP